MAIFFRCDVGYTINEEGTTGYKYPTNLSEVIFTDTNKYFPVLTVNDVMFPSGDKTIAEFQNQMNLQFGDDFYYIYGGPRAYGNYLRFPIIAKDWIPSIDIAYYNLWSAYNTIRMFPSDKYMQTVFYLKDIHKVIIANRIYEVENGVLASYTTAYWSFYSFEQDVKLPVLLNYTEETNLANADYYVLSATINTTSSRPSSLTYDYGRANNFARTLFSSNPKPVIADFDPYVQAGESQSGGGDGTFSFTSTDIPIPSAPSLSASDTGFLTLYKPDSSQLKSLADYMWAGAFDIQNLRKLFADPMDAIIGCHIIPVVEGRPTTTPNVLMVGNISTGLTMPQCTEQYFQVDCGTIQIQPKWGAYLDYSPYSKLSLYLPYIGIQEISPDDCMGGSITVKYTIDILSGSCVVFVYCKSNRGQDGHTLYVYNGDCKCPVPVTAGQYANVVTAVFKAGIAGAQAGVGISAGKLSMAGEGLTTAAKTIQSVVKPEITRSGSIGGSAGLMGIQYPFLILTVPKMCIPGQQNTYIGYPSFVTMQMSELSGYTEIQVSHLNNMPCTQDEAEEIITLLGNGVIF